MRVLEEKRPWGGFKKFTSNEKSTVKILTLKPKSRFSLQYHNHREEFAYFIDNSAKVTLGKKSFIVKKGDLVHIKKRQLHRIQALGKEVNYLEIAFGKFDEKDIVRIADDYNRK